jgi:hypothetical protein
LNARTPPPTQALLQASSITETVWGVLEVFGNSSAAQTPSLPLCQLRISHRFFYRRLLRLCSGFV